MADQMNTDFDNDLEAFVNYDQSEPTQMSSSATDVKPVSALLHDHSSDFASNASTFSGPSYQYDSHRQQTGLPMGAYHSTLAINQAQGLHYRPGNHGFVMPTQTLNMPLTDLGDFDFARPLDQSDMDFDTESPADIPSMFYGGDGQSSISPAAPIPPRIYPGMHTQQANQAKIQAAQRRQEMIKQQQQRQLPAGQRPLPTTTPKTQAPAPVAKDPHVEESISRLLNRMRQNSTLSAADDDETSPSGGMSMPRLKKDEDDMDEDERLLNSEEGKKLSSKERRQLRNKVSARAFRSRRKEYINQLESEVAAKAQEANELRVQNRQLMEENTRLTDLTRMLLSSNAFSGFLQELSSSGVSNKAQQQIVQQQKASQQSQQQTQPQPKRKDVPAHEAARQLHSQNQHMQVGMTLIPETPIDMSVFDGLNSWNNVVPSNDFQVFSVTEMPEPPKLDLSTMSEKSVEPKPIRSNKKDLPIISPIPTPCTDRLDDLYAEESSPATVSLELPAVLSTTISKAALSSELLSVQSTARGSWTELVQMCNDMDESCDRISRMMC